MKHQGDSLLEILVSVALLGVILSGLYTIFAQVTNTLKNTRTEVESLLLCEEGINTFEHILHQNTVLFPGSIRENWDCIDASDGACTEHIPVSGVYAMLNWNDKKAVLTPVDQQDIEAPMYHIYRTDDGAWTHDTDNTPTPYVRQVYLERQSIPRCQDITVNNCTEQRIQAIFTCKALGANMTDTVTIERYWYDTHNRDKYAE